MDKGSRVRSVGTNLVAGAANIIYTCPDNHTSKVELLFIANNTSGNKTVTIKWHDYSENKEFHIVGAYTVSAYSYLKLDGSYLALKPGDYMTVTPEAGSTMDATVSVEEFFDPSHIKG